LKAWRQPLGSLFKFDKTRCVISKFSSYQICHVANGGNLAGKQLGLLREVVPKAAVFGMLLNPTSPGSERQERETQAAAQALGQQLHVFKASTERDIDKVFATLTQYRIGALLIAANALFTGQRDQLVTLAVRHAMPVLHYTREFR
jgi:putative tryptophan/tyrosine transport system substrate-binding protein